MRFPQIPSVRDANKITVGLVSVTVIAAAVAGAFAVGTLGILEDRYALSAVFEDSGGLRAGNDVRVAGVEVGEVSGVHPDFELGQVVVTFEVDRGVHLGPDTTADVAISTLLGGTYLQLGGTPVEPYLEDLPKEQRRIPLERTSVPFSVLGSLEETTRLVQDLDIDAVNRVVAELAESTGRNEDAVRNLVGELATVAGAINDRERQLRSLVGNAQQVTETLAQRDEQLGALVDSAAVVLDQLTTRRDELSQLLGSGNAAVTQLADLIESQRANLDTIIANLHTTLDAVDRQFDNVSQTMAFAGPTFTGLARVDSAEQPWLDIIIVGLGPDSANLLGDILGDILGPALGLPETTP